MVHAAVVALLLTGSFAEDDVYYHTQLLQTKVNPQKVSVDTTGNVQDDMALFQKSFSKTLHRKSKEVARAKFFATMKHLKGGPKRGGKKGGDEAPPPSDQPFGPPPPEAAEQCATYYGEGVDVNKCWSCSMQAFMSDDGSGWHPDPNVGMKRLLDSIDGCMGKRNHLTDKCEEYYGEEVALLDCMMCGMMCECESPQECDMDCHQGCMSFDESHYEEEEHHNDEGCGLEECKMFYGDDVSEDKCKECGEKCFEEAMATAESEEAFFNTVVTCSDACMGKKNAVSQQCEAGYGPDVNVFACFNCGMMCECDAEQCDHECHGGCMEGGAPTHGSSSWSDWDSSSWSDSDWATYMSSSSDWDPSYSSYFDSSWSTASTAPTYGALLQASRSGKVKNLKFPAAMRLYAKSVQMKSKAKTDTTDLMQTSKHLK